LEDARGLTPLEAVVEQYSNAPQDWMRADGDMQMLLAFLKSGQVSGDARRRAELKAAFQCKLGCLRALATAPWSEAVLGWGLDNHGATPLMRAAALGHAEAVEIYLPRSDPLARDRNGRSPLIHACGGSGFDVVDGRAACPPRNAPSAGTTGSFALSC
jgi:hypothetical protein